MLVQRPHSNDRAHGLDAQRVTRSHRRLFRMLGRSEVSKARRYLLANAEERELSGTLLDGAWEFVVDAALSVDPLVLVLVGGFDDDDDEAGRRGDGVAAERSTS